MHVRAVVLIIKPSVFLSCRRRPRSCLSARFPFRRGASPYLLLSGFIKGVKNQWLTEILIQTEIDYKIKKRIIHLDENYFWNHEEKKLKSISKYKYSIFSVFHPLLSTFYCNTKMQKGKRSVRDKP